LGNRREPHKNIRNSPNKTSIFYGDNIGNVGHLDIRTGKEIGKLKGFAGTVTILDLMQMVV